MKSNKIKYFFLFAFSSILALTGCGKTKGEDKGPYVRDVNYDWSFEDKEYLHENPNLFVGTLLTPDAIFKAKLGNKTFEEDPFIDIESTLNYVGETINSDNSNKAADFIYVNGTKLKRIVSDGAKGVTIAENLFVEGENTLTIKTGPYWSENDYNENINHGNQWQNCDDFGLTDLHLTLPTNKKVYPTKAILYYPLAVGKPVSQNNLKIVEQEYDPTVQIRIGDGWQGHDSFYGNTEQDGRYNIPFKVDFVFNYQKYYYHAFNIDSKLVKDGSNKVSVYENKRKILQQELVVDNTAPSIESNVIDNSIVNIDIEKIDGQFNDNLTGLAETYVKIDGKTCEIPCNYDTNLSQGKHTILYYAKDKAENTTFKTVEFYASKVGMFKNYKKTPSSDKVDYSSESQFKTTSYQATKVTPSFKQGTLDAEDATNINLPSSVTLTDGIPYQSMTFNVGANTTKIFVKYDGGTSQYERFAIKAKNIQTNNLDTLITGYGNQVLQFEVDVTNYKVNNQVELIVTNDLVGNGSDTLIWVTDTQHYTKFDDLNDMLYGMMRYCADHYTKKKAAYFVHTGDLVDDNVVSSSDTALVTKEWNIASNAHKIIEEVGMPNGVVTGNHDTSTSLQTLTYEEYGKYFGQDRFNDKPWFGGSLNNNASHYDLITIDDIDFMFVYLGYGVEGDADTIGWANDVIKRYPNRNVILATHDYLAYNNGNGITSPTSRYNEIFNQIIVPNDNVIMVLCGHDNGAFNRTVNIPNSNRIVHEILSDYQFVDKDPNPAKHKIGTVEGCSGSGFLREMKFDKKQNAVFNSTWSDYYQTSGPFGAADNFTIVVDFIENNRLLKTNSVEVYELSNASVSELATSQSVVLNNNHYVVKLEDSLGNYSYDII